MLRLILLILALCGSLTAQTLPPEARFVMSHFKAEGGGGDERLYVSWSPDGLNWTALNGGLPVWQPPGWQGFWNVVRDPTIIYANGYYWVAYTAGNYGRGTTFGLAKSTDLLNWTFVASVDATLPGATDQLTWNPVFFEDGDGSIHVTIAASPTGGTQYNPVPNMRVHEMHPINNDWTQWSTPVPLALPDANTNEGWIWKEADTYHIIYVSFSRGGNIIHASSQDLITGWGSDKLLGYASQEGGMILPKPGGGYRLYLETGNGNALGYQTADLDDTLSNPTPQTVVNATVPMRNGKMCAARNVMTFVQWQAKALATVPIDQRAALADADNDGLSNLVECGLGTNPLTFTEVARQPRLYTQSGPTGTYAGLICDLLRSGSDVSGRPEVKIGSSAWTASLPGAITESIALLSDGTVRFHLRTAQPLGDDPVLFRYSATLNSAAPAQTSPTKSAGRTTAKKRVRR